MKRLRSSAKRLMASRFRITIVVMVVVGVALVIGGGILIYGVVNNSLSADIEKFEIAPSADLRRVTAPGSQIIALRSPGSGSEPLLLFFPATGAPTSLYASFEDTAANNGYHVIAMPYANMRTERSICQNQPSCYDDVRREQLTGKISHYLPPLAAGASIEEALPQAINKLQQRDPSGNWQRYLTKGAIDWSSIVVAGHSQGGGVAAYTAHQESVQGVIMFSSPNDAQLRTHTLATWLGSPSATPASRYYGFLDTHDFYAPITTASWNKLLPGVPIVKNADDLKTLHGQLLSTSDVHFPENLSAHFAVARDTTYKPVWEYLLEKARQ